MKIQWCVLIFFLLFVGKSFGQEGEKQEFVPNEIYVKVKKEYYRRTNRANTNQVVMSLELPFLSKGQSKSIVRNASRPFYLGKSDDVKRIYKLEVSADKLDTMIELLKQDAAVEYVEKIPVRKLFVQPNDPLFSQQWHLQKIQAEQAWAFQSASSSDVLVAVIDNAFQVNHPDLQGNFVAGYDVSDNDSDPSPPNDFFNHGTHVAGIINAISNNALGIAGAGANRVKVMPVKVTPDDADPNSIFSGYEGIQWAVANGAKIISLSWGGYEYYQFEQDIINEAHAQGVLIIAAAGNAGDEDFLYPASYEHVLSVASTDINDNRSNFSSYGEKVDLSAPGSQILSTVPSGTYAVLSGTSMAAPLVAAAAGFLKHVNQSLSVNQLEEFLKRTSDSIDEINPSFAGKMGAGRLNLYKAVTCFNSPLLSLTIQTDDPLYICSTDIVRFKPSINEVESYRWYKDGVMISESPHLQTNLEGAYHLIARKGVCEVKTETIHIYQNLQKTPKPTVTPTTAFYCTDRNALKATLASSAFYGPLTSTYTGGTVGYDNFKQSSENPSVVVNGIGGTLSNLRVRISWQKIDGTTEAFCDVTDRGGIPFFDEVGFQLQSPSGTLVTLIPIGKYQRGTSGDSQLFTMDFAMNGIAIAQGSKPSNGLFLPQESFGKLYGEKPVGTWTLLPTDDSFYDPLCVSGFSITLETQSNNSQSGTLFSWYASEMADSALAVDNPFFPLITQMSGTQPFWVTARNPGYCESEKVATHVRIRDVPFIFAASLSELAGADASLLYPADSVRYADLPTPSVFIYKGNKVFSYPIREIEVQQNTVTICNPDIFILASTGCPGKIRWSNGFVGDAQIVQVNESRSWQVTCERDWGICQVPEPKTFTATIGQEKDLLLTTTIEAGVTQTFLGNKVTLQSTLGTPSDIKVLAKKSVTFQPGFQVTGSSTFEARIGGCSN